MFLLFSGKYNIIKCILQYNCHITLCLIYHKKWKTMRQQFAASFSWNLDNFPFNYRKKILQIASKNEESTKIILFATAFITISIQIDYNSSVKEFLIYLGIPGTRLNLFFEIPWVYFLSFRPFYSNSFALRLHACCLYVVVFSYDHILRFLLFVVDPNSANSVKKYG